MNWVNKNDYLKKRNWNLTSCLPTSGDIMRYFFPFFKNQNARTNDAVKQTIEAVTEIWLKSGIPMISSWLHWKQLLKIFESWKKSIIDAFRRSINHGSNDREVMVCGLAFPVSYSSLGFG